MANQEMGRAVMNSVIEQLAQAGTIEYAPSDGRTQFDHDRSTETLTQFGDCSTKGISK